MSGSDARGRINFKVDPIGEAELERRIRHEVSVGMHRAYELVEGGVDDIGLVLKMPGVDRVGRIGLRRTIGVEVAHQLVRHRIEQRVLALVRWSRGLGESMVGRSRCQPNSKTRRYWRDAHAAPCSGRR